MEQREMKIAQRTPEEIAEADIINIIVGRDDGHEIVNMVIIVHSFVETVKLIGRDDNKRREYELAFEDVLSKLLPFLNREEDRLLLVKILIELMNQV